MYRRRLLSLIALTLLPTALTACGKARGERPVSWVNKPKGKVAGLEHAVFHSQFLGHEVGASILLPANYQQQPDKHFKVVYYLHGWGGHENSEVEGVQSFVAQSLESKHGEMPIIVYPNGGKTGYFGNTERMIMLELIPYVEQHYRVIAQREARSLLGFSVGGTTAMRLAMRYPDVFMGAFSLGGRLWSRDNSLIAAIDSNHQVLNEQNTQIVLIQGDKDSPNQFAGVTEKLNQYGIPFQYQMLKSTEHNLTKYLKRSVPFYRPFLREFLNAVPQKPLTAAR